MADVKDASRRIVFTGASGGIGTMIRPLLAPLYPGLVLSDKVKPKNLQPGETFVAADLTKPDEVAAVVKGADSVIHLGGHSVEGPWEAILQANIIGCYNLFEAARQAGVKRVVFASSNHAVGFYPRKAQDRHRPHGAARQPLRRQQGVRRGAGRALCRQARHGRDLPQYRQCRARVRSTCGGCRSGSRPKTSCS